MLYVRQQTMALIPKSRVTIVGRLRKDDPLRCPSHADRRKALRRQILRNELSTIAAAWPLPRKIIQLAEILMDLAV